MPVKPIPDRYHAVTPYVMVEGAAKLVEFLKQAFDAKAGEAMTRPDGSIAHGEVEIGNSVVMLSEARDPWKPMPAAFYLYVSDVDASYKRALAAGATSIMEPADQFYGDRHGGVKDPTGNMWWIATHVEDVPPEEMSKRAAEWMKQNPGK